MRYVRAGGRLKNAIGISMGKNRDYLMLHPSGSGPTITMMRVGGHRVFVQLVEPQPPNLPPGLVLVEMPPNYYVECDDAGNPKIKEPMRLTPLEELYPITSKHLMVIRDANADPGDRHRAAAWLIEHGFDTHPNAPHAEIHRAYRFQR